MVNDVITKYVLSDGYFNTLIKLFKELHSLYTVKAIGNS